MTRRSAPRPSFLVVAYALAAAAHGCMPGASHEARPPTAAAIPPREAPPVPAVEEPREEPPPSGITRPFRMPVVTWADLPSGLRVATVVSRALPLVHVRVVVPGGSAADGERPGLAALTGELIKDGGAGAFSSRALLTRVESLGATITVATGPDATVLGLAVTRDHLAEALDLLGLLVQRPRLEAADLGKLKARAVERASESARTDGGWGARRVLFRDLYALPSELHPYATIVATPGELSKITAADCRAFHARWFVPKNTLVVVAGDSTPDAVRAAVEGAFTDRRAAEPPTVSFTDPLPQESLKITVVDRPLSPQSDIFVGVLGPERGDAAWPWFAAMSQVLGGGPAARLSTDVQVRRSLALATDSQPFEVARGPVPLVAYAGSRTEKTGLAVAALLEHAERLARTAPDIEEVDTATQSMANALAIRMETIGDVADEVIKLRLLGLPDTYHEGYRKELRDATPALVGKVAGEHLRPGHAVVVVAGDARVIAPMLSRFGDVKVVDPTREFERVRTVRRDPAAALQVDEPRPAAEQPAGGGGR